MMRCIEIYTSSTLKSRMNQPLPRPLPDAERGGSYPPSRIGKGAGGLGSLAVPINATPTTAEMDRLRTCGPEWCARSTPLLHRACGHQW